MNNRNVPIFSTRQIALASREVPYTLRVSRRAWFPHLTIRPETGLVATIPMGYPQERLAEFMRRHQRWILRHLARVAAIEARIPKRWPYGPTLSYRGEERRVVVRAADQGSPGVERTPDGTLVVRMRRPSLDGARRLLKRWYLDEAVRWLPERAAQLGGELGISWRRVRVADQRSRWGSCSLTGSLSFNYRLVMAPPSVMDYVVVHELLHRLELNHSRRFWALVAASCPAYRESITWLKTHGPYLGL